MSEQTNLNKFRPLGEIAAEVADEIRARCPGFKQVQYAALSNAAQLWDTIDTLILRPAAIVCIGTVSYPQNEHGLSRELQLIIAVSDEFRLTTEDKAEGIWSRIDELAAMFSPQFGSGGGEFPEYAGLEWRLESVTPGAGDQRIALFYVNLTAKEYALCQ